MRRPTLPLRLHAPPCSYPLEYLQPSWPQRRLRELWVLQRTVTSLFAMQEIRCLAVPMAGWPESDSCSLSWFICGTSLQTQPSAPCLLPTSPSPARHTHPTSPGAGMVCNSWLLTHPPGRHSLRLRWRQRLGPG